MRLLSKLTCMTISTALAFCLIPATASANVTPATRAASSAYGALQVYPAKKSSKPKVPKVGRWIMVGNGAWHNPPVTGVSYKVKWSKVKGAAGYQVRFFVKLGKKWQLEKQYKNGKHYKQLSQKKRSYTWTNSLWCNGIGVKVRSYKTVSGKKTFSNWSSLRKVTWR